MAYHFRIGLVRDRLWRTANLIIIHLIICDSEKVDMELGEAGRGLKKSIEPEILENHPWEGDVLDRRKIADVLRLYISNLRHPFVLSINASYGDGKSFFIRRWERDLCVRGYKTAFFNAWQTDYTKDPFMAVFAELEKSVFSESQDKKGEAIKKKGKKLIKVLSKNVITQLASAIFDKVVDVPKLIEDMQENKYNEYKERREAVEEFKKELKGYAESISTGADEVYGTLSRPIVIFVDELDRCRPDYAIEVLETIKHLFDVPGYVFVLGIAREELEKSVSAVYGPKADGQSYIKKFIDWDYSLPAVDRGEFIKLLYRRFYLDEVLSKGGDWDQGEDTFFPAMELVADAFDLSLRDIEQYFTRIDLVLRHFGSEKLKLPALISFLVVLRDKEPKLYSEYVELGEWQNIKGLLKSAGNNVRRKQENDNKIEHLIVMIIGASGLKVEDADRARQGASDKNTKWRWERIRSFINYIQSNISLIDSRTCTYLHQHIEGALEILDS